MPWFLPYLLNWRGGSGPFNPSLISLPKKAAFRPRSQEPKQCILRCENTSRSFTSCVMASSHRAQKQWCLSKVETIKSFENWKQNLLYTLSLDSNFAPFLADGVQWLKKSKTQPLRGLENEGESVPLTRRLTARQKVNFLELILGQIANYCPIISRSTLVKNSTSLEFVWQTIRQHFGFQATGAQFIDFADIHLAADKRPEDLYQRLMAFVEAYDNSDHPSCGRSPVSFPVLHRQYAYPTCLPSLARLGGTSTSARPPLSLNQQRSQ